MDVGYGFSVVIGRLTLHGFLKIWRSVWKWRWIMLSKIHEVLANILVYASQLFLKWKSWSREMIWIKGKHGHTRWTKSSSHLYLIIWISCITKGCAYTETNTGVLPISLSSHFLILDFCFHHWSYFPLTSQILPVSIFNALECTTEQIPNKFDKHIHTHETMTASKLHMCHQEAMRHTGETYFTPSLWLIHSLYFLVRKYRRIIPDE